MNVSNPTESAAQPGSRDRKGLFQLQAYRVLHPVERLKAVVDPRLVELFHRIMRGGQDCALCRQTLDLDAESLASPGVIGYLHGDLPAEVPFVGVAACISCTFRLGDEGVLRAIGQEFVDSCAGGGTVELVRGGAA
jgi:hypothetical protein